jgi:hypothetical protein
MGFVERALAPVTSAITRAVTPPGTVQSPQQQAQAAADAQAAAPPPAAPPPLPPTPIAPQAPSAPPQFVPGAAPGSQQRSRISATSILGAAAASGQQARKSLLGQ